ncbi:hypothetical protein F183_A54560 (plasmid) [Bryobacterales bacterium F-183]|nr:hypothetical protein F183_A54560 [Bryobacterales bacterium F-183]
MNYKDAALTAWNGLDVSPEQNENAQFPGSFSRDNVKSTAAGAPDTSYGRDGVVLSRPATPPATVAPRDLSGLPSERVILPPSSRIVNLRKGASMGADRMRLLRMRLWELRRMARLETIAVTSALPKDGKSTLALNTASVLSDGNRHKVLLVEADLHCPSVGKNLGIPNQAGVCECLDTGGDPFQYIRRIEPMGWYLMQAGNTENHPTDLVQSSGFGSLLEYLRPHFDWIVVDTPPVFPVADTMSICQLVDGVMLVVRSNVTPRESVEEAVQMIGSNRIAAIVLNGAEDINRSYYKYSSYYYANHTKK